MFISSLFILLGLGASLLEAQNVCYNSLNGTRGRCVFLLQCPSIYQMFLIKSKTIEQIHTLRDLQCRSQNEISSMQQGNSWVPSVCCLDPQNNVQSTTTPQPDSNETCGTRAEINKIVGGKESALVASPWLVLVEYRDSLYNTIVPHCAGSLISKTHVLTAAHCIIVPPRYSPPIQIRLGEHDMATDIDCEKPDTSGFEYCNMKPTIIPVESYKPHERYSKYVVSRHNDIGIIKMATSVEFTDFIKLICLPSGKAVGNTEEGSDVSVAGWGKTETGHSSNVKKEINITITSKASCQRAFYGVTLNNGQICAGGDEGIDSCNGDSGGPLMSLSKETKLWEVIGIVSFGKTACGTVGSPGVYINVAKYITWIKLQLLS